MPPHGARAIAAASPPLVRIARVPLQFREQLRQGEAEALGQLVGGDIGIDPPSRTDQVSAIRTWWPHRSQALASSVGGVAPIPAELHEQVHHGDAANGAPGTRRAWGVVSDQMPALLREGSCQTTVLPS